MKHKIQCTHHYYNLTLPADAQLGRYRFELEDVVDGQLCRSLTADTDYFLVEQLYLERVIRRRLNFEAYISNPSPERVMMQLCEFGHHEPHARKIKTQTITLQSQSTTR